MSKFKPGPDPRRNMGGRPRARIAELREVMGQLSQDGRTVASRLHEIIMDPESSRKEIIEASALWFAYLVGKPEQAVNVEGDLNVTGRAQIDTRAVLAALPSSVVEQVVGAFEAAEKRALPAGEPDED